MKTKIPVFLKLMKEISIEEFQELLKASGLGYIMTYQAMYMDNDHKYPCIAFNMKGESHEDLANQLQKILSFDVGRIDFIFTKSKEKAYCSLSIYEDNMENIMSKIENMIDKKGFSAYFMQKNETETHMYSILERSYLSFLDYSKQKQEIDNWRETLKKIYSATDPDLEGFMELKYSKV